MSAASLAMFPGQGSHYVGMGKDLLSEFPYTKHVFEEAEDAACLNIRKLCFDGPESDLTMTANQQPAILAVTAVVWKILQSETPYRPNIFAGHSLGEYSALVAAGKLSLSTATKLVRFRGEAMQRAVPEGIGAMAAVMNCDADALQVICNRASKESSGCVEIVNYNSPQQLIISGHKKSVNAACAAMLNDPKVRCVMLPVSAPFHSKLMKPARDEMTPLLLATQLADTDAKIIPNLTGKLAENYEIDLLIQQIDHPVLWTQTLNAALALRCLDFVEIGPGRVLSGLARRCLPKGVNLLNTDDICKTITDLAKF